MTHACTLTTLAGTALCPFATYTQVEVPLFTQRRAYKHKHSLSSPSVEDDSSATLLYYIYSTELPINFTRFTSLMRYKQCAKTDGFRAPCYFQVLGAYEELTQARTLLHFAVRARALCREFGLLIVL